MFLLSFPSALKEQENKVSALVALRYRPNKLHVRANNICENIKQKRKGKTVFFREEIADSKKVKTTMGEFQYMGTPR